MAVSTVFSSAGDTARFLCLIGVCFGAPVATTEAHAQNNASRPNEECMCSAGLGSPPDFGPRNFWFLIDGRRYDISTYKFFRSAMVGSPEQELPSQAQQFFDSGMYRIIPEVEIVVGPGYGYAASIANGPGPPYTDVAAGGFDTEFDIVDTEPPVVGENLRVTTRIFTNDCGSKAIYFEDGGTSDNFSALVGSVNRLPVLVRIRSVERDVSFTTFSTTFGFTNDVVENVISYYPFTGWCIGERGLESLDFKLGEAVEFELTVYDYAGNAGAPKTQTIRWPIDSTVTNGAGGEGDTGAEGGRSGCSAAAKHESGTIVGLVAFVAGLWVARRRFATAG